MAVASGLTCAQNAGMNLNVSDCEEPVISSRIGIHECDDVNGWAVDFRSQKQRLLERATRVEKKARRETNAQAQDLMLALAVLYREMARELDEGSVIPSYMH